MIKIKALGHIKNSLGKEELSLEIDRVDSSELIDILRKMAREDNPGFNRYNTIMLVNDGEAFIPAQQREIKSGDYVVLVPFSHGG